MREKGEKKKEERRREDGEGWEGVHLRLYYVGPINDSTHLYGYDTNNYCILY